MVDPFKLLGKPFEDSMVQAFMGPGMKYCYVNSAGQIACPVLGVDLVLGGDDGIRQVTYYPNASGDYRSYTGPLPFGLARRDTREGVASKLGRPDLRQPDVDLYTSRSPRISVKFYPEGTSQAGSIARLAVFLVR
jgi:hypothetical protein